jgi:hypothetical protein
MLCLVAQLSALFGTHLAGARDAGIGAQWVGLYRSWPNEIRA